MIMPFDRSLKSVDREMIRRWPGWCSLSACLLLARSSDCFGDADPRLARARSSSPSQLESSEELSRTSASHVLSRESLLGYRRVCLPPIVDSRHSADFPLPTQVRSRSRRSSQELCRSPYCQPSWFWCTSGRSPFSTEDRLSSRRFHSHSNARVQQLVHSVTTPKPPSPPLLSSTSHRTC